MRDVGHIVKRDRHDVHRTDGDEKLEEALPRRGAADSQAHGAISRRFGTTRTAVP